MADAIAPDDSGPAPRSTKARSKIKDIAKLAGVDESTVSRALNPTPNRPVARTTVERITRIAEELGYRPNLLAMGLRRGRSQTIGLVVPDITDAYNGFVIRGIQDEAEKRNMSVLIMEDRHDRDKRSRTLEIMVSRQVEALIVMTAREGDELIFDQLAADMPIVFCLQHIPGSAIPSVTTDDRRGGELAAGYLAQLGHRVVGQLMCDLGIAVFKDRRDGFVERAEELGLELVPFSQPATAPNFDDGRELAALLLASTPILPTGVFVHTDLMAIGAIRAFESAGLRCPEDISVVSFDASPLGKYFNPSLTSIGVAAYDIGRKTGEIALQAADGATVSSHVFSPVIVHGTSSAAATART